MVFSSTLFLFIFLPITLFVYYLLPSIFKNIFLLLASLIFYAWGELEYSYVMILSIFCNYIFALTINKFRDSSKPLVAFAIIFNLLLLFYFKYASSFLSFIGIPTEPVPLPLGISFFTFHALSYVIDIYRKNCLPQKNLINLGLYISNFAQLVAGPIVRYPDISNQLKGRKHSLEDITYGIKRFIIGLGKKVLIANTVAETADHIFNLPLTELDFKTAWIGIICYALQIYFDFSGYSDMAIGLGRMFGFHFLENFNYPYISKSIKEFWRRWHISLSNWFRDYLYIPLGGNRVSKARSYMNLLIVFFLCGLWHGASLTFIIWGLWHGSFLIIERTKFGNIINKSPVLIQHIYTLLVILIGWVFFWFDSTEKSLSYLKAMFTFHNNYITDPLLDNDIILAIFAGILGSMPILSIIRNLINRLILHYKNNNRFIYYTIKSFILAIFISTFLLSIMSLASGTYNPFIYFRF